MTVICLLGMHRSGTSCLAGSLQAAGLFAGEVYEWNTDNLKGHRENQDIMDLNNDILENNNSSWKEPPDQIQWSAEHCQRRDQLIAQFYKQSAVWMFKDPRTVLLLPFWQEGIKNLLFLGSFRHPLEVALSLYHRSQISLSIHDGIQLWLHYNRQLLAIFDNSPFPLICFDLPQQQYLEKLQNIINHLNQQLPQAMQLSSTAACQFYDSTLVHHKNSITLSPEALEEHTNDPAEYQLLTEAETVYQALRQAAGLSIEILPSDHTGYIIPLEETVTACQKVLQLQPNNPPVYFILGNIQSEQGNIEAAIADYKTSIALDSQQLWVYKKLGKLLIEQNHLEEAIALFQEAAKVHPDNPDFYCSLGKVQGKQGNIEAAIISYRQAIQLYPQYLLAYHSLGQIFIQQGQIEEAIAIYQQALELKPNSPYTYLLLGNAYRKQEEIESAIASYEKGLALNPNNPAGFYLNLGEAFSYKQQFDRAMMFYEKVLELQQDDPNPIIYFRMGNVEHQQSRFDRAIADYQKAIQLQPDLIPAHVQMGHIKKKQGEFEEAITHYQKVLEINPNHFVAYKNIGDSYKNMGNIEAAITAYQEALKIKPNNQPLLRHLNTLQLHQAKTPHQ
ncbi:MAG: tetratricopeptide repeat protein [Microcoleaceae cyanobacterium]